MKQNEFDEFLNDWRTELYFGDLCYPTYMEKYLSKYNGEHHFNEEQLMQITAFLSGSAQEKVILMLGKTELLPETYLAIAQAVNCIAEIKVSYPLKEEDFAYAQKTYPKITLNSVFSTEKNIIYNVQGQQIVLNSSHFVRSDLTRTNDQKLFDADKALLTLQMASQKLQDICKKNHDFTDSIKQFIANKNSVHSSFLFAQKILKEIWGKTITQEIFMNFPDNFYEELISGLQSDETIYERWALLFKTNAVLLDHFKSSNPTKIRASIDRSILLFADFISLNQNQTVEFYKGKEKSLNTKELEILREVMSALRKDVVSDNYQMVTTIFNATELTIQNVKIGMIGCTPSLEHEKIIPLLVALIVKKISNKDEGNQPAILIALEGMKDFFHTCNEVFSKLAALRESQNLREYDTINEKFGLIYDKCLKMVRSLQNLEINESLWCKNHDSIENMLLFITQSAKEDEMLRGLFSEWNTFLSQTSKYSIADKNLETLLGYVNRAFTQADTQKKLKSAAAIRAEQRDAFFPTKECSNIANKEEKNNTHLNIKGTYP